MTRISHKDQYLIKGIASNDSAVINEIYDRFLGRIAHFIKQNNGSEADARDLFQEALIAIYQKSRDAEPELSAGFFTYLYAICRNLWLKKLRKKGREGVTMDTETVSITETGVEDAIEKQQRLSLYREKFKQLGEDCRKLLELFFEGVSMSEIAERLSYSSVGYVKKRKFQCKQKLVEMIQQDPLYRELVN